MKSLLNCHAGYAKMFRLKKLLIVICSIISISASCSSTIIHKPSYTENNYNIWAPSSFTFEGQNDEMYQGFFALLVKQNGIYNLKELSDKRVQRTLPNEEILYFDVKFNRIYPAFEKAFIFRKNGKDDFDTYCCFDILIDPKAVNNVTFYSNLSPNPYEACKSNFIKPSKIQTHYIIDKDEIKLAIEQTGVVAKIIDKQHNTKIDFLEPKRQDTPSLKFVNTRQSASGETARINVEISGSDLETMDVCFFINGSEIHAEELISQIDQPNGIVMKSYNIKIQRGLNIVKTFVYDKENKIRGKEEYLSIVGDYELDAKPSLHAVIIGIDGYKNEKLNLNFAEADANLFGTTLYKHTKDIFENVNIHYLRKKQGTTKNAIINVLNSLQNISPNDFFIFYSASHGLIINEIFYMFSSDVFSTSENSLKIGALNHLELLELFKRIPTANKLLLFDTCHSGLINSKISKQLFEHSQKKMNITSISAAQSQQTAMEGYADGHGVFTYVMSDALEGEADLNGDGIISSIELVLYANEHVPKAAMQFNHIQLPASFQAGQVFPVTKHKQYQKSPPMATQYFQEEEIEKLLTNLREKNIALYNKMIKDKEIETEQKMIQIKKDADRSEALIVENEFKFAQYSFAIDRFKFIFHDDSVFLAITDKIKDHYTFIDDRGHKLLVLDFHSNLFTKHSVNHIDTTKILKIDIGWHNTFYRVTLHLKKLSFYDLKSTESGIFIKIRDR
jgi:hypothetical protein